VFPHSEYPQRQTSFRLLKKMKINFKLPNTRLCLVLWYRDNKPQPKILLPTPPNNTMLRLTMVKDHHVGESEIRSVQPVKEEDLLKAMGPNFRKA
jgi:hypothetical protein